MVPRFIILQWNEIVSQFTSTCILKKYSLCNVSQLLWRAKSYLSSCAWEAYHAIWRRRTKAWTIGSPFATFWTSCWWTPKIGDTSSSRKLFSGGKSSGRVHYPGVSIECRMLHVEHTLLRPTELSRLVGLQKKRNKCALYRTKKSIFCVSSDSYIIGNLLQ